eukprot:12918376-Prorocentrum_lima.AAC.1
MDAQDSRSIAQLTGVVRTLVLDDSCALGQQQAQHRESHVYTIFGSSPGPIGLASRQGSGGGKLAVRTSTSASG